MSRYVPEGESDVSERLPPLWQMNGRTKIGAMLMKLLIQSAKGVTRDQVICIRSIWWTIPQCPHWPGSWECAQHAILAILTRWSTRRRCSVQEVTSPSVRGIRRYSTGIRRYCMCWPPLIAILAPVTNAASSLARYATSPATSSGLPAAPWVSAG